MYKPKPIKGLSIEYDGQTYNKITYLSCSNEGLSFDNTPGENTTVYVRCKVSEAKINVNDGGK